MRISTAFIILYILILIISLIGWVLPLPVMAPTIEKEVYVPGPTISTTEKDTTETPIDPIPEEEVATIGEKNCLSDALNYLNLMGYSKSGLIKQLEFDEYSETEIEYALARCGADWNEEALQLAYGYTSAMSMSKTALQEQLIYEGFEESEINYALEQLGYK